MAFLFKFHAAFKRKSFRNRARAWLVLKIGAKMFQNSVPLTERQAGTTNDAASAWKPLPTRTPESPVEIEASASASKPAVRGWNPRHFVRDVMTTSVRTDDPTHGSRPADESRRRTISWGHCKEKP